MSKLFGIKFAHPENGCDNDDDDDDYNVCHDSGRGAEKTKPTPSVAAIAVITILSHFLHG